MNEPFDEPTEKSLLEVKDYWEDQKPQSPEARNVKIRCQRDWKEIAKGGAK